MPNIKIPAQLVKKMIRFENNYLHEINLVRKDTRREMLDIIQCQGIKISTTRLLKNAIRTLETDSSRIQNKYSALLDQIVIWYMDKQIYLLEQVGENDLPEIQILNNLTYSERLQIYDQYLDNSQWISNFANSISLNITRLSVVGAEETAVIDRLLSEKIADGRASVFRLSGVAAQTHVRTDSWVATLVSVMLLSNQLERIAHTKYEKQAIAAIDHKTTDCCLRVHGQIQPMDKPFILEGTPRFADKMHSSPFHWGCRTSISLYVAKMELFGIPTAEMKDAAMAEIKAREETGYRKRIWPSHSTSRRK